MATSSVNSTSSATSSASTSSTSGFGLADATNQVANRDDFLKLLVAQMKNQDPLKPQDNTQFVAELAQFSNLEQTQGINSRLDLLALQSRGQSNTQVSSLIGQQVTIKGSMITSDGSGIGTGFNFTLPEKSAKTVATISNSAGQVVRTIDIGAHNAGLVTIQWDGRNNSGLVQPKGSYSVSVKANNSTGGTISVEQNSTAIVKSISYDSGYPVLQLANGATAPVSDLLRVSSPPTGS